MADDSRRTLPPAISNILKTAKPLRIVGTPFGTPSVTSSWVEMLNGYGEEAAVKMRAVMDKLLTSRADYDRVIDATSVVDSIKNNSEQLVKLAIVRVIKEEDPQLIDKTPVQIADAAIAKLQSMKSTGIGIKEAVENSGVQRGGGRISDPRQRTGLFPPRPEDV